MGYILMNGVNCIRIPKAPYIVTIIITIDRCGFHFSFIRDDKALGVARAVDDQ